ncbi:MAG: L-threonylcarbamoyladenylate synthase [Phycisphaerae bacterium]
MRRAVFLDRDGTIIEDRGHLRDPSQVVFFPYAFDALRQLQKAFQLFIVTNQPGVAAGKITPREVDRVNAHVIGQLAEAGVEITDVYVCPHSREDGCSCIKPHPYFLQEAAKRYQLDLSQSFTVGDHPHDVELAYRAGAHGIYVLTGHGQKHLPELLCNASVAMNISQAAERILAHSAIAAKIKIDTGTLRQAAAVLRDGGTVAFPTETVYGLGANARDAAAVARIFEIKRRPRFDPLIVHVCSVAQARQVVRQWPNAAEKLARQFWPGPLTLVLPKAADVPDIVTSGLETVAIRMPNHPLALALIAKAGAPLAAPSANLFGGISPTTSEHVQTQLGAQVDIVLEGGPCSVGVESTILSLVNEVPVLLRAGGTPVEDIERVVGPVKRPRVDPSRPTAPGQCLRHYAPRTPTVLCDDIENLPSLPRTGLLTLLPPYSEDGFTVVEVLSAEGDLREAAGNLFAALHRLDAMGLDRIVAMTVPDADLGLAINDRLRRAANGTQKTRNRKEWT